MKIPDKIQVAGKVYKIIEDETLYEREHRNGEITYNTLQIKIYKNAPQQVKEEVFCHEITHAILEVFNGKINCESLVNPFGELLYQVIKQL